MELSLLLGIWLLGCAAAGLWQLYTPDPWRLAAMAAALCASGVFALWRWRHTPVGTLAWDAEGWRWSAQPQWTVQDVESVLDLQSSMLLRWKAQGASQWIWLDRDTCVERWDDLRRAVYSRARAKALQPASRPAAKP